MIKAISMDILIVFRLDFVFQCVYEKKRSTSRLEYAALSMIILFVYVYLKTPLRRKNPLSNKNSLCHERDNNLRFGYVLASL